jgi:hypothetical protein
MPELAAKVHLNESVAKLCTSEITHAVHVVQSHSSSHMVFSALDSVQVLRYTPKKAIANCLAY